MKTMLAAAILCCLPLVAGENQLLRQIQTIPLPKVEGRIDHMAIDVKGERLFVAALGNNSLEVVDLKQGTGVRSVPGFKSPQGVLYVPGSNRVYVANGGDGTVRVLDTGTWQPVRSLELGGDADNLRYDPVAKRIYAGFGDGALAAIDPTSGKKSGEVKVGGHPESFQLEKAGSRIFVNVPKAGNVTVVDRKTSAVLSKIPSTWAQENFPMALDENNHRLLVGARKPGKLLVLDTSSLQWLTEVPIADDTDDLFYDAVRSRVYVICGSARLPGFAGQIYVLEQQDPDHYRISQKVNTAPGARTGLYVPELNRLYVAVPHKGDQAAEIRVFEAR